MNFEGVRAWIVAGRYFTIPWMLANTFLGASLAGLNLWKWLLAFVITQSVLTASHYLNNIRDFQRGIDTIKGGSAKKAYTAAQQILPSGILSVRTMLISVLAFMGFATGLLVVFCPLRLDVILIFLLGATIACSYSDFWKPKGMPEPALFLGHGLATLTFAFALVKPITLTAAAAGVLLGMWAAGMVTLDQYKDVGTDLSKRIRSLAWMLVKVNMPISQYWSGMVAMIYVTQLGFVLMELLPPMTLLTILLLPLAHLSGIVLESDFDRGIILTLLAMWIYPILMTIGVLI